MFTSVIDDSVCMSPDNVLMQSSKWLAQLHINQQIGRRHFEMYQYILVNLTAGGRCEYHLNDKYKYIYKDNHHQQYQQYVHFINQPKQVFMTVFSA